MDIGSADRLALQNLWIPEGSTDIAIPLWLFPGHSPTKQRPTAGFPDTVLVTAIPTKRRDVTDAHPQCAS